MECSCCILGEKQGWGVVGGLGWKGRERQEPTRVEREFYRRRMRMKMSEGKMHQIGSIIMGYDLTQEHG